MIWEMKNMEILHETCNVLKKYLILSTQSLRPLHWIYVPPSSSLGGSIHPLSQCLGLSVSVCGGSTYPPSQHLGAQLIPALPRLAVNRRRLTVDGQRWVMN